MKIIINGSEISEVQTTKFLGVIIDNKLSWKPHIDYISTKISKSIGVILRARKVFNKSTLLMLYYSLIYPYLTYCVQVWGSTYDSHKKRLIILQKKIVRIICGVPPRTHTGPLFEQLNILRINYVYFYNVALFMYKFSSSLLPVIFATGLFTLNCDVHQHSTRQANHLHIPLCKTNRSKFLIKYQGPVIWNKLSSFIDIHCSIGIFKKRVKSYLLTNPHMRIADIQYILTLRLTPVSTAC